MSKTATQKQPKKQQNKSNPESVIPKAKKIGKPKPNQAAAQLAEIVSRSRRVLDLQAKAAAIKSSLKAVNELLEAAQTNLIDVIIQPNLPFGQAEEKQNSPKPEAKADANPEAKSETPVNSNSDGWKSTSVSDLVAEFGLPKKTADAMINAGYETLGKVSAFLEAHPRNKLTDIKGIGETAAEKYEAASLAYYKAHPEYCKGSGETKNEG